MFWVMPADQGFVADDVEPAVHYRLVVQQHLTLLKGTPQILLQSRSSSNGRLNLLIEKIAEVAPSSLGLVHGNVSTPHDISDRLFTPCSECDADTACDPIIQCSKLKSAIQTSSKIVSNARNDAVCFDARIEIWNHHHKLVPSEPGNRVAVPHFQSHPSGNFAQQLVTNMVAM